MEEEKERLIACYNEGIATPAEIREIEKLISDGKLDPLELRTMEALSEAVAKLKAPEPSASLDSVFYENLSREIGRRKTFSWGHGLSWSLFLPRIAAAGAFLLIGIAVGYYLQPRNAAPQGEQLEALSREVSDLREMILLSMLEKGTATERLKAVNLSYELDDASRKVTEALIQTLNHDGNVNVRLAAIDALKPYARDSSVREALIRSIALQDSPLVQISMAELMAALQERSAVREFEKIIGSQQTPPEVKKRIMESIDVLI